MDGYYTNFTYCVNSSNKSAIVKVIVDLLGREENCSFLPNIPYLAIDIEKLAYRSFWEKPPLIVIGLAEGKGGWTIIKSFPNEWLFLRPPGIDMPRLSLLVQKLQCDAFFYRVVGDIDGLLVETNKKGICRFDPSRYPFFKLLSVSPFIQIIQKAMGFDQEIADQYQERRSRLDLLQKSGDGKLFMKALSSFFSDFKDNNAADIDRVLAKELDISQNFWGCYDFYSRAYGDREQLASMDVKLLYFLPPDNYLNTLPAYDIEEDEF